MKKTTVILMAGMLALGTGAIALARGGNGGGNSNGYLSQYMNQTTNHEELAKALGLTADELTQLRTKGMTLAQIALQQKVDYAVVEQLMVQERTQAINQALKDGKITADQAAWMTQNGFSGGRGNGLGNGNGMGRGNGMGQGFGRNGQTPQGGFQQGPRRGPGR